VTFGGQAAKNFGLFDPTWKSSSVMPTPPTNIVVVFFRVSVANFVEIFQKNFISLMMAKIKNVTQMVRNADSDFTIWPSWEHCSQTSMGAPSFLETVK